MHGAHAGRRTRAAGGVTLAAALALAMAPAASAQVAVPDPTTALPSVSALPTLPATPGGCTGATARASAAAPAALRASLLCAINVERAKRGLPALPADPRIEAAASAHARDMVRRRYFAHQRAGGPGLSRRLRRAGWRGSAAGEAIAYGCGALATPLATLRMWLNSPPHRAILLDRGWSSAGVGVSRRAPVARCRGGGTWVLDAGR
jgi:uncharacterized protein YkwD